jgi:hypothetical protein
MDKKPPLKKLGLKASKKDGAGETAPAAASDPAAETKPLDAKAPVGKALGKKAGSKPPAVSAAKVRSKKAKSAQEKQSARPPRGGIAFICSECYEEFNLPATYAKETVSCPECMHVGKRPAEDFLRTVSLHKSGERNSLKMALFVSYALAVVSLILIWAVSPYSVNVLKDPEMRGIVTPSLAGLAVVLLAILVAWAVPKYEKNRWEIYF